VGSLKRESGLFRKREKNSFLRKSPSILEGEGHLVKSGGKGERNSTLSGGTKDGELEKGEGPRSIPKSVKEGIRHQTEGGKFLSTGKRVLSKRRTELSSSLREEAAISPWSVIKRVGVSFEEKKAPSSSSNQKTPP